MIIILKKINRLLRGFATRIIGISDVIGMVWDPVWAKTRYPDMEPKSRLRILAENISWLIRHGEANRFYWLYGFDRIDGVDPEEYIPYTTFKHKRNELNRLAGIGGYYSDYTVILKDKFIFSMVLSSLGFPAPQVRAVSIDGTIRWLDDGRETGLEELAAMDSVDLFCKTLMGECADGVCHITGGRGSFYCDGRIRILKNLKR